MLQRETLINAIIIAWNVVSSLACIFLNKIVFTKLEWPHGTLLQSPLMQWLHGEPHPGLCLGGAPCAVPTLREKYPPPFVIATPV